MSILEDLRSENQKLGKNVLDMFKKQDKTIIP